MPVSPKKLLTLTVLYFTQGLPFGFFVHYLPIYLRRQGVSLEEIGWLGLLALPWSLKFLWSPLVDKYYLPRLGRRRSWIIPMQFLMGLSVVLCLPFDFDEHLRLFLVFIFLLNLFSATQDIAVDGFAVDILRPEERGLGNSAQVAGYKLGMILGGGLLVAYSNALGARLIFPLMGLIIWTALLLPLFMKEPAIHGSGSTVTTPKINILRDLKVFFRMKGVFILLIFVTFYKFGESFGGSMFKVFLVDRGFSNRDIGFIVGTYGIVFSFIGSAVGGFLVNWLGRLRSLIYFSVLQASMLIWLGVMSTTKFDYAMAVVLNSLEHLFGGMVTTAFFTFMMDVVDPRIGGVHYTLLASCVVVGMTSASVLAGYFGSCFGYTLLFICGGLLALFPLLLLGRIKADAIYLQYNPRSSMSSPLAG
ncbi:MAG: muropeptide transporter [Candidatus Methanolliviera sp. GoM_oil]|nr:MAG: muropeptide transporter [Candidatus Methanolliviera sp. GoM_oil]